MSARRRLLAYAAVVLVGGLLDCAKLEPDPTGTCGNGVVDDQEDCDTFPAGQCGSPGGAAACRLTCGPSAGGAKCPDGWGCGVDGICRQPTGVFAQANAAVSTGVASMSTGDLDGDGRRDIVALAVKGVDGEARARVHYFAGGAALDHVTEISTPISSPAVGDYDGDGVDDLAFGIIGGFAVMTGQADRSLVPLVFPSFTFVDRSDQPVLARGTRRPTPTASPLLPATATASVLVVGRTTAGAGSAALFSSDGKYVVALPVTPDDVVGAPAWGEVLPGLTSTCGEVVVAINVGGAGQIWLASPCSPDAGGGSAWSTGAQPLVVPVKTLVKNSGVLLADVNRDGALDLVYQEDATKDAARTVYVAINDRLGSFKASEMIDGLETMPIAVGDFNGDGFTDYVLPTGIALAATNPGSLGSGDAGLGGALDGGFSAAGGVHVSSPRGAKTWTAARAADLNADGIDDLVAIEAGQPDVDYFGGDRAGVPVAATIETTGPVSHVDVADLDGDGLKDVVFVEGTSSANSNVAVAYAQAFGQPGQASVIGRVAKAAGLLDLGPAPSGSPTESVGVLEDDPNGTAYDLAVILGSGDRAPLSPLVFAEANAKHPSSATSRAWAPFVVRSGPFSVKGETDLLGVSASVDVATAKIDGMGAWLAKGAAPSSNAPFAPPAEILDFADLSKSLGVSLVTTATFELPTTSADVDGDGLDDVVTLAASAPGSSSPAALVVTRAAAPGAEVTALGDGPFLTSQSFVKLVDVDGDGAPDVVALLGGATAGTTELVVYFNDGHGRFPASGVPIVVPNDRADAGAVNAAIVTTAAGGASLRQLAVDTAHHLFLATLRADKHGFDLADVTSVFGTTVPNLGALVTGDFDGDGVEDIAVADGGSIRIARQKSRLP